MMAVVQSATVAHYCSTTGRGAGELSLLVPIETVADLAAFREIGRRRGDPSLPVGVELADVLAERDTLRRLVGKLAQRIQFARLADPNPGGEDPLLREAAAVCKRAREEART